MGEEREEDDEESPPDARVASLAAAGIAHPSLNPLMTVSFFNAFLGERISGTPDEE